MLELNFNLADTQSSFDLLATGIYPLTMMIKSGNHPKDSYLTQSKSSDAAYLDCEFIVADGPLVGRKFWIKVVVSGGKVDDEGNSIAGNISKSRLRAILESARNILPTEMSEAAMSKRHVASYGDFNGMTFLAKVGTEKSTDPQYDDKNKILKVITPDMKDYNHNPSQPVQQAAGQSWGQAQAKAPEAAKSLRPAWATK